MGDSLYEILAQQQSGKEQIGLLSEQLGDF